VDGPPGARRLCSITRPHICCTQALRNGTGSETSTAEGIRLVCARPCARFDFAHFQRVSAAELREIVTARDSSRDPRQIPAKRASMDYEGAVGPGRHRLGLGGEVRTRTCGCCALWVSSPMELLRWHSGAATPGTSGLFKIVAESGARSRRCGSPRSALTAKAAARLRRTERRLAEGPRRPRCAGTREELEGQGAGATRAGATDGAWRIARSKDRLASGQGVDLAAGAVDVHGVKVVLPPRWTAPTLASTYGPPT